MHPPGFSSEHRLPGAKVCSQILQISLDIMYERYDFFTYNGCQFFRTLRFRVLFNLISIVLVTMAGFSLLVLQYSLLGLSLLRRTVEAASSSGCDLNQSVQVGQTSNITVGDRWYLLYFPEEYNPTEAAPLILSFHGGNRNASQQQQLDLLSTTFFNKDHVVVYPNAIDASSMTRTYECPLPPPEATALS